MGPAPSNIDAYIAGFPPVTQVLLEQMRATIQKAAPDVIEAISYGIPTFKLNGRNLVHFGGYAGHIGFYPGASPIRAFQEDLGAFNTAKGTVQFPLDKKLPLALITRIVKFRLKEEEDRKPQR